MRLKGNEGFRQRICSIVQIDNSARVTNASILDDTSVSAFEF